MYLSTGFHFMCTLALGSLVLFYGEVDHMIIWFSTKNIIRQFQCSAGLFPFYI